MPFDALTLLHTPPGGTRRARMACAMEVAKAFDAVVLHYSYLRDPRMSRAAFTPPVEPIAPPRVATFEEVVPWMSALAACGEALDAWGHSEATARDETVDWIRSHWKRTVSLFVGNITFDATFGRTRTQCACANPVRACAGASAGALGAQERANGPRKARGLGA